MIGRISLAGGMPFQTDQAATVRSMALRLVPPGAEEQIDAGTVTFDQVSSEATGRCTDVNYDPLVLPSGIEPSDDPLLSASSAVYARSFTLRAGQHAEKPPGPLTAGDVGATSK